MSMSRDELAVVLGRFFKTTGKFTGPETLNIADLVDGLGLNLGGIEGKLEDLNANLKMLISILTSAAAPVASAPSTPTKVATPKKGKKK